MLLATTALASALAPAGRQAAAQTAEPGGSFDLIITGSLAFLATYGDLKEKTGERNGSYDFRNDTELAIQFDATDEATGLAYGGEITFVADTDETDNTDETWIYLSGEFGEVRFGDDDGVYDNFRIAADTVAVGTGGLDGDVIDTEDLVAGFNSSDATKVIYYAPQVAGFQGGFSFTPHLDSFGQNIGTTQGDEVDDLLELGVVYNGEFDSFGLTASLAGYTLGHTNETDQDTNDVQGGVLFEFGDLQLVGNYTRQRVAEDDRDWYTLGAAYSFEPYAVSVNWGDTIDADDGSEPSNFVLGAEVGLMPGVSAAIEISAFNEDRGGGDNGVLGLGSLSVSF